jgi:hypothetical protein
VLTPIAVVGALYVSGFGAPSVEAADAAVPPPAEARTASCEADSRSRTDRGRG